MKNIVFIIGSLKGGGAERVLSILSNYLSQYYKVTIITLFNDEIVYELDSRVNYLFLGQNQESNLIVKHFSRLKKLRNVITDINPEIVVSFLTVINILTISSLIGKPYPIIVSERNDPMSETPNQWIRFLRNVLYYSSKKIHFVFQTPYARSQFKKNIEDRTKIIFNPIKKDLPLPYIGVREKRIVCVARLEPAKNHKLLFDAFYHFNKIKPGYKLELYGIGPLKEQLENYGEKLRISKHIDFKGFSNTIIDDIHSAEMFVLPSNYEGISNAMLESLAIGVPTISTDSPAFGARLFINSGISGYLTPVGDVQYLTETMLNIAGNQKLQKKLSQQSKKIKNKLDESLIVAEWQKLIEEIINV